jgi:hypothetical protein
MNLFYRPFTTTTTTAIAFRNIALTARPHTLRIAFPHIRTAASSVSGRPGSQTIEHAATNIKEEVGNSAADLAKRIAAANMTSDAVKPNQRTFVSRELQTVV